MLSVAVEVALWGVELHLWTEMAGPVVFQIKVLNKSLKIVINEKDVAYPTFHIFGDMCVTYATPTRV